MGCNERTPHNITIKNNNNNRFNQSKTRLLKSVNKSIIETYSLKMLTWKSRYLNTSEQCIRCITMNALVSLIQACMYLSTSLLQYY